MKVFIAGGSGLLGRGLIKKLKENSIPFVCSYNSRPCENGEPLDYSDMEALDKFVLKHKPTVCINCIVQRQVDVCDKDWAQTKLINIDYAANLARICASYNIYLIHISTDYVFDGARGDAPYSPHSAPNPLNNYGISKLISEHRVRAAGGAYVIVRVPVLYTDSVESLEESAVTLIGKKVMDRVGGDFVEDGTSIRRPVYIPDFVDYLLEIAGTGPVRETLHHYYNPLSKTTKYDMTKLIANFLNKSHGHIKPALPSACVGANRPYDTELQDTTRPVRTATRIEEGLIRAFARFHHPPLRSGSNILHLFDLDGTLLDTDRTQYLAYADALMEYGIELSWKTFEIAINNGKVDDLMRVLGITDFPAFKSKKNKYMKIHAKDAKFMAGAETYLTTLLDTNQTVAVVTNTSQEVVEYYKDALPLLSHVQHWIKREDYSAPKPDPECYQLAKLRWFKDHEKVIGYENTLAGYNSISSVVDIVYIVTQRDALAYKELKQKDVYLISDFSQI